jgi:hypothetical protein
MALAPSSQRTTPAVRDLSAAPATRLPAKLGTRVGLIAFPRLTHISDNRPTPSVAQGAVLQMTGRGDGVARHGEILRTLTRMGS